MADHTLGQIFMPELMKPEKSILDALTLNADVKPLTLSRGSGLFSYSVAFEGTTIGHIRMAGTGPLRRDIRLTLNEVVPVPVQRVIAKKLEWITNRVHTAFEDQRVLEQNAHQDMLHALGPITHPKVKVPTPFGWKEMGALCYPGMLTHLLGDHFEMQAINSHSLAYGLSGFMINYADADIKIPAMRIMMDNGHAEIWGRGNRERARAALGESLLDQAYALARRTVADPDLLTGAREITKDLIAAQPATSQFTDTRGKALMSAARGEPLDEDAQTYLQRAFPHVNDFPDNNDSWAWHSPRRPHPCVAQVDLGHGFAAQVLKEKTISSPNYHAAITFKGVRVRDAQVGFLPGTPAEIKAPLVFAAETALADVHPAFAATLPWRPEFVTEVTDPKVRLARRMLEAFDVHPTMEM